MVLVVQINDPCTFVLLFYSQIISMSAIPLPRLLFSAAWRLLGPFEPFKNFPCLSLCSCRYLLILRIYQRQDHAYRGSSLRFDFCSSALSIPFVERALTCEAPKSLLMPQEALTLSHDWSATLTGQYLLQDPCHFNYLQAPALTLISTSGPRLSLSFTAIPARPINDPRSEVDTVG